MEMPASARARSPDRIDPGRDAEHPLLGERHHVLRVRAREGEYEAILRQAELGRTRRGAHQDRHRRVHVPLRGVQLGVRERQHGVLRRRVADGGGVDRLAPPGVRVARRDLAEAGVERGDGVAMLLHVEPAPVAQRRLDHGVELDRGREPALRLEVRHPGIGRGDVDVRRRRIGRLLGIDHRLPGDRAAQHAVLGFAAGHEADVLLAGHDGLAEVAQELELEHAQLTQDAAGRRTAELLPDQGAGIRVVPPTPRDRDRVELSEQRQRPGVSGRPAPGLHHQAIRLGAGRRVVQLLLDESDTDDDGGPRMERSHGRAENGALRVPRSSRGV